MTMNAQDRPPTGRDPDDRLAHGGNLEDPGGPTTRSEGRQEAIGDGGGLRRPDQVIRSGTMARRERIVHDVSAERRAALRRLSQLVSLTFGVIEVLIGLRVLLMLVAANPINPFAHLVYEASTLFLGPFFGLVSNPSADGMVLEMSSLIAMLVYALAGWALDHVIWLLLDRPVARTVSIYEVGRD